MKFNGPCIQATVKVFSHFDFIIKSFSNCAFPFHNNFGILLHFCDPPSVPTSDCTCCFSIRHNIIIVGVMDGACMLKIINMEIMPATLTQ